MKLLMRVSGVNIDTGAASGGHAEGDQVTAFGDGIGFEHIVGSRYGDELVGNRIKNNIEGGRGDESSTAEAATTRLRVARVTTRFTAVTKARVGCTLEMWRVLLLLLFRVILMAILSSRLVLTL